MTIPSRPDGQRLQAVTLFAGDQWLALPVEVARDVFHPSELTTVPLAPHGVAGVLNLRGRIVAAIDVGAVLQIRAKTSAKPLAIMMEWDGDSYALLVDRVGEVVELRSEAVCALPTSMPAQIAANTTGLYRHDRQLLTLLDPAAIVRSCGAMATRSAPADGDQQ